MRMPRWFLLLLALTGPAALAAGAAQTTAELRQLLIEGHAPVTLEAATRPGKPDTLSLPVVEVTTVDSQKTPFGLHIVWHHCNARRCTTEIDPRPVRGDPRGVDGTLTIDAP